MNTKNIKKNKQLEQRIYGVHACRAVFKNRPQDIIKGVLTKDRAPVFSELMQYLAKNKRAYNIESSDQLSEFAKTVHHEGICLLVKTNVAPTFKEWQKTHHTQRPLLLLALENIDNPHNLGAIIRSAAHFSISALFYSSKSTSHTDSAVARVAQGGVEYVPIFKIENWQEVIEFCKVKKVTLFSTSDKAKKSISVEAFKEDSLILMGNEGSGLSDFWKKVETTHIKIDGTNLVESLNVSVASGILLSLYRQKYPLI